MNGILNTENELDVKLFDSIVEEALSTESLNRTEAETVLIKWKQCPNSWLQIDQILNKSLNYNSKFTAIQVLEDTIKRKWRMLSSDQRDGLKAYILHFTNTNADCSGQERLILKKFNKILIEILKKDWPKNWPTFITDTLSSAQTSSIQVCKNNIDIISELSDEIFLYEEYVPTVRKVILKKQIIRDYPQIFQLQKRILEFAKLKQTDPQLVKSVLICFQKFCRRVPLSFIIETDIVNLIAEYLDTPLTLTTLDCLIEIFSAESESDISTNEMDKSLVIFLHSKVTVFLIKYFGKFKNNEIATDFKSFDNAERDFVYKLCIFYSQMFSLKLNYLLNYAENPILHKSMRFLLRMTEIDDDRTTGVLTEMWESVITFIYHDIYVTDTGHADVKRGLNSPFSDIFNSLVGILVNKMPRPEEVFIMINEYKEIVRNKMVETEDIEFCARMNKIIHYLSYLDIDHMKNYLIDVLTTQTLKMEWSKLNRYCWAIGAVAGVMDSVEENKFFVDIIKDLLGLCESKVVREDRAVIASNIMFIIAKYNRFFIKNTRFMHTVIHKLFEFMHEQQEGIKDMACDTFLTIANASPDRFYVRLEGESDFLVEVLAKLNDEMSDLEFFQKRVIYEGICRIISHSANSARNKQYTDLLFTLILNWNIFSDNSFKNLDKYLSETKVLTQILHLFKSYTLIYRNIFQKVTYNLDPISSSTFRFYRHLVSIKGDDKTLNKNSLAVKKEILLFLIVIIEKHDFIKPEFISDMFVTMFSDDLLYTIPEAHSLFSSLSKQSHVLDFIRLNKICVDFLTPATNEITGSDPRSALTVAYLKLVSSYLETVPDFYKIIITNSELGSKIFSCTVDGISNYNTDIALYSIEALECFIRKSYDNKNMEFFLSQTLIIIENLMASLFDKDKSAILKKQCRCLTSLIRITPLIPNIAQTDPETNNQQIISLYIFNLFIKGFKHIDESHIKLFVQGIFSLNPNVNLLMAHVNDFRAQIYEFCGVEYLEEEIALLKERTAMVDPQ